MTLRQELQSIYDQYGKLTPPLIVDVATDEKHPLHNRFEWDNAVAGDSWRQHQAHELIRSVHVVYDKSKDGEERSVRAFHAIRTTKGFVYEPIEKVVSDPILTQVVRAEMEREWRALKRRFDQFDEFWRMVTDDLEEKAA